MVQVNLKAEWKSVSLEFGALYAMISGMQMMQPLYVDNWDIPLKVSSEIVCINPSFFSSREWQNNIDYNTYV